MIKNHIFDSMRELNGWLAKPGPKISIINIQYLERTNQHILYYKQL